VIGKARASIECLMNMKQLVGKGRFHLIGFPLKIRGGTGNPICVMAGLDA
jgi:kynurenine formamidase